MAMPALPRQTRPELEHDYTRSTELGYEPPEAAGFIRCLSHGFPTPLARWHYHDEYELHLITATSGKVFVGDWIGQFQPRHLVQSRPGLRVLPGPRLPHNWISMDLPEGGVPERDLVIQFQHAPIAASCETIPELRELLPLLERARHGVEFFGLQAQAAQHWQRIKARQGLARFAAFCGLMSELAHSTDFRLLSSTQLQSEDNDAELDQINAIVSRITDLVNLVRVNRACQLLMETDHYITRIAYDVGFNNMANFNRRFLNIKGMTPSEYRKQGTGRFGMK